jgi:hypothetical protein
MGKLLDCGKVVWKETSRVDGSNSRGVLEGEEIGDELIGDMGSTGTQVSVFGTVTGMDASQPGNVP